MHLWCTCLLLLWSNEVLGYGEMSYGAASGQSIRIGKSIVTHLSLFSSFSTQHSQVSLRMMRQTECDRPSSMPYRWSIAI